MDLAYVLGMYDYLIFRSVVYVVFSAYPYNKVEDELKPLKQGPWQKVKIIMEK